ncbi:DUF4265 domain-containing protein [Paraliomyxa miuraensis]|uniref:DUF4265 domain-containing protein n=1 Tax=Paraliomyxa miuraensis TaxID=376150 RepID=UPI00224C9413|nr:DUF4265 domain-containing protein [Paraliomyxa miuraensis]MCX4245981.1 DUF4265 domain-containing protein [Paraliomyxa miuraensis]
MKVLFEVENEGGQVEFESLWAIPVPNGYQLDNIPFYARNVAYNDIISAQADQDGALRYAGLNAASGHSTIRLWFADELNVAKVRDHLREMGCSSELDLSRLVAVDVPPSTPYSRVRAYLDQLEAAGVFEYEEACLGQE